MSEVVTAQSGLEETSGKNRGVVRVDMQFLPKLLHIPDGHEVIAARINDGFTGCIELLVEGPDCPLVDCGQITPYVNLTVTVTESDVMVRDKTFEGKFI